MKKVYLVLCEDQSDKKDFVTKAFEKEEAAITYKDEMNATLGKWYTDEDGKQKRNYFFWVQLMQLE